MAYDPDISRYVTMVAINAIQARAPRVQIISTSDNRNPDNRAMTRNTGNIAKAKSKLQTFLTSASPSFSE